MCTQRFTNVDVDCMSVSGRIPGGRDVAWNQAQTCVRRKPHPESGTARRRSSIAFTSGHSRARMLK